MFTGRHFLSLDFRSLRHPQVTGRPRVSGIPGSVHRHRVDFIEEHRGEYGVEPICAACWIANPVKITPKSNVFAS